MGPLSANATFVANRPGAFINETTLWDPLDNPNDGFAARRIIGAHTWIPGVGLRMDEATSHVAYELPNGGRIEEGELSAIISNTPHNTEYTKTKVLSMTGGYHDATTNHARMSLEKRGDAPTGGIAWRFITTEDDGVDTIGGERDIRNFDFDAGPHFWQATWRHNFFNVLDPERRTGRAGALQFRQALCRLLQPRAAARDLDRLRSEPQRSRQLDGARMIVASTVGILGSAPGIRESVISVRPGGSLATRPSLFPFALLLAVLPAGCGGSSTGPTPNPPPPVNNALPVVTSIVVRGTNQRQPAQYASLGDTVNVTATVTDAETPVSQLTYEWSSSVGEPSVGLARRSPGPRRQRPGRP